MKLTLAKLPYLSNSGAPYQHTNQPQFVCTQLSEFGSKSQHGDVVLCVYSDKCIALVLRPKMRQHVGAHVVKTTKMLLQTLVGFVEEVGLVLRR